MTKEELVKMIRVQLKQDAKPFNMDSAYREMLDDCYSFKSVGGPFEHMSPSHVLEEMDPTWYRCGLNDYADGVRDEYSEVDGEYYSNEDIEEARGEVVEDLEISLEHENDEALKGEWEKAIELAKSIEPGDLE